jgi:hypothetical protein
LNGLRGDSCGGEFERVSLIWFCESFQ